MMGEWPTIRLGDYAEVNYGYTAKASFEDVGPKFLRITDIQDDGVDWDLVPTCPIDYNKYKKQKLQHGDIVFARTGATTGKSFLLENPPDSVAASYLIRLRLHDSSLLPAYVWAFFKTYEYWEMVNQGISGSAQGGFNASKLAELSIPLPPLPEQKRIVAILDDAFERIDTAIANTEKNLANARELFESYLNNVFTKKGEGWVEKTLSDAYDVRDGTHDSPKYHEKGYPLITSKNLDREGLHFNKVKYISEEDYNKINVRSGVAKGDVLFAMIGTIGNPIVVEIEPEFSIKNVALFKPLDSQNSYFLKFYLESPQSISKMEREAKGTTQRFVGLKYLRGYPFVVPPLEVQNAVVDDLNRYLVKTKQLELVYQQKLAAFTELKQSILQKAFAGELTADMNQDDLVN